jgi:CHAP domain
MRARSCLAVLAVLVAVLAGYLAAAPAGAAATGLRSGAAGLSLSPATQRHLIELFAKKRGVPAADVGPIAPGAVLGPRTSSGRQWMMVSLRPATSASVTAKLKFQTGDTGVFTRRAGHAWTLEGLGGEPAGCNAGIPANLRHDWQLPSCTAQNLGSPRPLPVTRQQNAADTSGALVDIALAQVGVSDNPASPPADDFDPDCNPYTTLVGNPDGAGSCGARTSNGAWFSNVETTNEEWCADFTKWVWEQAGITSGLTTLNPAAASFYTWAADHGESVGFGGAPQVGDAVLFYPAGTSAPNGNYADHVGIVSSINGNGSLNLVDGDFLGSTNISVQYNTDVSGPSWYSPGEEWAFVSPKLPASPTAYVFWKGQNGALWEAQGSADSTLSGPTNRGMGTLGSQPTAGVDAKGATYVYWEGTNGDLWEAYWTGSGWAGPVNRGMGPLGSPPTVAITPDGTAYVFWKGTNGHLYEAQGPADGALSGPTDRGMGTLGSAPTAGVDASGATYVYWKGTNGDLWEAYWTGSGWAGPVNRGMGTLGSPPAVAITSNATAYVFWQGTNGDLYEAQGPADGTLSGPTSRGMGNLDSTPTAGVGANGATYVYWEGPGSDLWEGYWDGSGWAGPDNRGMGPLGSAPSVAIFG